jgi:hypothetical protein
VLSEGNIEGRRCLFCDAEALRHIELKDHYLHFCNDHFRDLLVQTLLESLQPADPSAEKLTKEAIVRIVESAAKQLSANKSRVSTCGVCGETFPSQRKLVTHVIAEHLGKET